MTSLGVIRTGAALMVRSDKEPRRMGLGSASSAASWRRRVGGGVLSMLPSYGYILRKTS
jgi:hypothetical protein